MAGLPGGQDQPESPACRVGSTQEHSPAAYLAETDVYYKLATFSWGHYRFQKQEKLETGLMSKGKRSPFICLKRTGGTKCAPLLRDRGNTCMPSAPKRQASPNLSPFAYHQSLICYTALGARHSVRHWSRKNLLMFSVSFNFLIYHVTYLFLCH